MEKYVITISRTYGSGGRTMGKMLAKELGVEYYDKEILSIASEKSGINEKIFWEAEESIKKPSLFKRRKKIELDEVLPADNSDYTSADNLFNYQAKVIKELAEEQSCVILGRCADYILKDYKNAIRIFCYASLEDCIKRESELNNSTRAESIKIIEKKDKERREYYKYNTGTEWGSAKNYDLCLNTGTLSYDEILEIVKMFVEFVHARKV